MGRPSVGCRILTVTLWSCEVTHILLLPVGGAPGGEGAGCWCRPRGQLWGPPRLMGENRTRALGARAALHSVKCSALSRWASSAEVIDWLLLR